MNCLWLGGLRIKEGRKEGCKEGRYIMSHQGEKFQQNFNQP